MVDGTDIASTLAIDAQNLGKLRLQAKQSPEQALKGVAQQFEAVFMNMMLKSMREATPQDGMLDSEQTKMFTSMLDQQLAQNMSTRGIGLADVMVKQLSRYVAPGTAAAQASGTSAAPAANAIPAAYSTNFQQGFVQRMLPHAEQASRASGVPAQQMIGQAALESGWGQREIRMPDGSSSHNLFGIKAGASWHGKVAEVTTTEYHNGVAHKQVARFRAYDSYAQAFNDYANLLSGNPRYAEVLKQGGDAHGFANALQQSGYATDPDYASKLAQVIDRVNSLA
ncbi:MAG: flagellar assembly peptidoglycan hydrolase FlgJ [Sideroxydans sp.]|nr:flagellar assembly peptidoglycan hydrolase FlgJ [Sideroxydans sp.]